MGYSIYKLAGTVGKTIENCLVGGSRDCLHVFHPRNHMILVGGTSNLRKRWDLSCQSLVIDLTLAVVLPVVAAQGLDPNHVFCGSFARSKEDPQLPQLLFVDNPSNYRCIYHKSQLYEPPRCLGPVRRDWWLLAVVLLSLMN